jgi:serine/threonine protein kinase
MSDSTKTRWERISDIFELALQREPSERSALIESESGGDSSLRREVEDLVVAHEASSSFMAQPVLGQAPANLLNQNDVDRHIGKRIGPYKVISELGRGGMGTVCLAVRDDEHYQKRVAIKFVKRGMDTEEIVHRFRYERQILASLDHVNIARILDGGTTDDGLPYFVMEYVEGLSINQYCDAHKLTTAERLNIFGAVCLAVSYAHQNLVVHRDLKPSNIIVTEAGQPKLLDFGIAKVLKPDLFPQTVIPTGLITRPMTPDYASPEQVRGLPITTASDIYSLGVLLYELLTGHRPYRLKSHSPLEIERVICEEQPERPSTVVNRTEIISTSESPEPITISPESVSKTRDGQPDKLRRRLAGDLDNILLMALRKEPKRRYASVEQFSEDIRRHLEGLPVLAHKDTFLYRSHKFVRRNRIALSIAVLFVVLLTGFTVAFRLQAQRAQRQRIRAERVSSFMAEIFKVADPNRTNGKTVTAREILDAGAARLENELDDQPETKATLLHTVGEVYESLGLFEPSKQMFEKALALRRQVLGNQSEEVAVTLEQLGLSRSLMADYSGAETNYVEALAIWRNLHGNKHERVSGLLEKLGRAANLRHDWETAANYFRQSLVVARQLHGDQYQSAGCRDSDRGSVCSERTLAQLAFALQKKGDLAEAEKFYRQAVEVSRRNNPNDYEMVDHRQHDLANFISDTRGGFDEAERLHREVLDNRRRLYGDKYIGVGYSRWSLSFALDANKKYAEAEFDLRENAKIYEDIFGREHPRTAWGYSDLGHFLIYQRKFDQAEKLLRETSALQIKSESGGHPLTTLPTRLFLATLLNEKGDRDEAEKLLLEIVPEVKRRYVAPDDILGLTLLEYGKVLLARGKATQAEPFLRAGWENLRKTGSAFKWTSAEAESALGECLAVLGRQNEAAPLLEEGLRLLNERLGDERKWIVERARQRLAKVPQLARKEIRYRQP